MAKASGVTARLQVVARTLARAPAKQVTQLLYQAVQAAALAGRPDAVRALVQGMYATPPARVVTALSTHAIDVVAHAAGLGDLTGGQPTTPYGLVQGGSLDERVAAIARGVRARLTTNAFAGGYPTTDAWRTKSRDDVWYAIDRWRRVQALLRDEPVSARDRADALERLREILADDATAARPPGGGQELVLALELALDAGARADVDTWLTTRRAWLELLLLDAMMCVPTIARAMMAGELRAALDAPLADVDAALADVLRAAGATAAPPKAAPARPAKAPPKVQRRTVDAAYSQLHLEPAIRTGAEARQLYFQDRRESAQGMSIFPTMVGIATPSDTGDVTVAVRVASRAPALDGAVQAVSFPLTVGGPLVVRGVADPDDVEPLVLPPGAYDVHAAFTAPARPARGRALRRFALALTFCPATTPAAPRCHRLEDGSRPPARVFAQPAAGAGAQASAARKDSSKRLRTTSTKASKSAAATPASAARRRRVSR